MRYLFTAWNSIYVAGGILHWSTIYTACTFTFSENFKKLVRWNFPYKSHATSNQGLFCYIFNICILNIIFHKLTGNR